MDKIRVLIVDDSFFMRKVIKDILQTDPAIEIVGEAVDGEEALKQVAVLHPAVVALDIEMPRMSGLQALQTIVDMEQPPAVVMVSGYAEEGADITLQCLALGAVDFVLKPSGTLSLDMEKVKDALLAKIKTAAKVDTTKTHRPPQPSSAEHHYRATEGAVVIGASTGGPAALEKLLPAFPANFPYPVIVAQHLPKIFGVSFSSRLNQKCSLPVTLAENNMELRPGIYIARGGTTTTVTIKHNNPTLSVEENNHDLETPSVSKLMISAADIYGEGTVGVILTGMGNDGLAGMKQIKAAGGTTIVQDEETSAVYGMGNEVVKHDLADAVVPLTHIMDKINEAVVT